MASDLLNWDPKGDGMWCSARHAAEEVEIQALTILSLQGVAPFLSFGGENKAHRHTFFALVRVRLTLGQPTGSPDKKLMCSPPNPENQHG